MVMRLSAVVVATAGMVAVSGCAHTVTGVAVGNPHQSINPLRGGDTGQVLVSPAQVYDIAGSVMQVDADQSRPVFGSSALAACSALESVGMATFVGKNWSAIRVLLFTEGERHDQVVAEAVAIYPDAAAASDAFTAGTKDTRACDGQRALSTGSAESWAFNVPERTIDTVRRTKRPKRSY